MPQNFALQKEGIKQCAAAYMWKAQIGANKYFRLNNLI
jgi:hypothetical protein